MNDRFNIRYFNKNTKEFEYLKIGAVNFNLFTDWTVYEQGQFCTGLKDKNGTLIYEGDILQQPQLPHKVVCEWYKDGFWLNGFMNGAKRELRNMHNCYEVIGNIYENKEILE